MDANIGRDEDILTVGANRAIDLIVTKEQGGGRQFGNSAPGRPLGDHPEGGAVTVKAGRFGSYVNWGKVNATIPRGENTETITLERAIELLKARASGAPVGGGRVLGEHPLGGTITVRDGRYGAYVNVNKVNATIPKTMSADTVTLADAIELIDEKGGPGAPAKGGKAKAAPGKKAPAKKTAAKKSAGKATPKAKVKVESSDATPFDVKPAKKAAAKKAPAKKAAKKSAAKKKAPGR